MMTSHDPDAQFRTFVRTGDPQALAAVFDALAGDLLLIAAHVARNGSCAEDLVQSTFLLAIEARKRFDTTQPVRPWLIGILANQARASRRKEQRRPDPERLREAVACDPGVEVQADETIAIVADAIAKLSEPYRQVVHLRLVHALELRQIASALGIPLATAKSRLHRGTERLRRALPTGIAIAGSLMLSTARLSAMRAAVLHAVPAIAVTAGPAVISTKMLLRLAMIPLLLLSAVMMRLDEVGAPEMQTAAQSQVAMAEGRAATDTSAILADVTERAEVAVTASAADVEAPASAVTRQSRIVSGQCVDAQHGAGLAASVRIVKAVPTTLRLMAPSMAHDEPPIATAMTDGNGRFQLLLPACLQGVHRVVIQASGRIEKRVLLTNISAGNQDLGVFKLDRGMPLILRCVDEAGQLVEAVRLAIVPPPDWLASGPLASTVQRAQTSAAGIAELTIAEGQYELHIESQHKLIDPSIIDTKQTGRQPVTVRVKQQRPTYTVRGVLVDELEQVLAGHRVVLAHTQECATSDANGEFAFEVAASIPSVLLICSDSSGEFQLAKLHVDVPTEQLARLQVKRYRSMQLRVTRADNGAPIERFAMFGVGLPTEVGRIQTHRAGIVVIPKRIQHLQVIVVPEDDRLAATKVQILSARKSLEHRITVPERVTMNIRVVDARKRAVAGATVALLEPGTLATAGSEATLQPIDVRSFGAHLLMMRTSAITDRDGTVKLSAGRGQTGLMLRVTGDHLPFVERNVLVTGEQQTISVSDSAQIVGHVDSPKRLSSFFARRISASSEMIPMGVFLTQGPQRLPVGQQVFPIRKDGSFQAIASPGSWQVHLWVPTGNYLPARFGWSQVVGRTVALGAGEQHRLSLATDEILGSLHALVRFDGKPWANREITLKICSKEGFDYWPNHERRVTTDEQGRFELNDALHGAYQVLICYDPAVEGTSGQLLLEQKLEVHAGRTTTGVASAARRVARARFFGPDGQPMVGYSVGTQRFGTTNLAFRSKTDEQGWCTLDPVPFGPLQLAIRGYEQQRFHAEMSPQEVKTEWVFKLR